MLFFVLSCLVKNVKQYIISVSLINPFVYIPVISLDFNLDMDTLDIIKHINI